MKRSEKEQVVSGLTERLRKAKGIILAEYRGLKVSEITEIRREVKKNAGDIKVIKNRLFRKSIVGSEMAALDSLMKGPLAVVFSDSDPVVLSKVLTKFAENYTALKLKAGFLQGKVMNAQEVAALAKLPSREELYAKLLGTLIAPASGLVRTLNGVPQKLAIALKAIAEKKQ